MSWTNFLTVRKRASKRVIEKTERTVLSGGEPFSYELIRRSDARRLRIRVNADGKVSLTGPRRLTFKEADSAVEDAAQWIAGARKKLAEQKARCAPEMYDGDSFLYRGQRIAVRTGAEVTAVTADEDGAPVISLALPAEASPEAQEKALVALLKQEAQRVLGVHLAALMPICEYHPAGWKLSSARTRWGCCTREGNIRLSWRLIFLPDELGFYVAAHELAHLKEFNHSAAFWKEVGRLDPDWQKHRAVLKTYRPGCLPL